MQRVSDVALTAPFRWADHTWGLYQGALMRADDSLQLRDNVQFVAATDSLVFVVSHDEGRVELSAYDRAVEGQGPMAVSELEMGGVRRLVCTASTDLVLVIGAERTIAAMLDGPSLVAEDVLDTPLVDATLVAARFGLFGVLINSDSMWLWDFNLRKVVGSFESAVEAVFGVPSSPTFWCYSGGLATQLEISADRTLEGVDEIDLEEPMLGVHPHWGIATSRGLIRTASRSTLGLGDGNWFAGFDEDTLYVRDAYGSVLAAQPMPTPHVGVFVDGNTDDEAAIAEAEVEGAPATEDVAPEAAAPQQQAPAAAQHDAPETAPADAAPAAAEVSPAAAAHAPATAAPAAAAAAAADAAPAAAATDTAPAAAAAAADAAPAAADSAPVAAEAEVSPAAAAPAPAAAEAAPTSKASAAQNTADTSAPKTDPPTPQDAPSTQHTTGAPNTKEASAPKAAAAKSAFGSVAVKDAPRAVAPAVAAEQPAAKKGIAPPRALPSSVDSPSATQPAAAATDDSSKPEPAAPKPTELAAASGVSRPADAEPEPARTLGATDPPQTVARRVQVATLSDPRPRAFLEPMLNRPVLFLDESHSTGTQAAAPMVAQATVQVLPQTRAVEIQKNDSQVDELAGKLESHAADAKQATQCLRRSEQVVVFAERSARAADVQERPSANTGCKVQAMVERHKLRRS